MKRKSFILLIAIILISFSTICFATDMGNNVKNTVNGATNTVVDGAQNLAEDIRSGIGTAENTIENGATNMKNSIMDTSNDSTAAGDNDYTVTRTGAEDVSIIDNTVATTWIWVIVAIAAAVIVGLVWYYASQYNDKH